MSRTPNFATASQRRLAPLFKATPGAPTDAADEAERPSRYIDHGEFLFERVLRNAVLLAARRFAVRAPGRFRKMTNAGPGFAEPR